MLPYALLAAVSAQAASDAHPYGVPDGTRTFSYEQRDLLTWVNAVRVEPTAWDDFLYWASFNSCSSASFTADELAPKAPLSHDLALEAMAMDYSTAFDNGDTPAEGSGYEQLLATAYDTGFSTTFNGWVCNPAARAIVLGSGFDEAGTGVSSSYYTLAMAESDGLDTDSPVVNGSHMIDFSRANGNPWYFVAPSKGSSGGC